jgi:hypothetical protein
LFYCPDAETKMMWENLTAAADMSWKALKARRPSTVFFRRPIAATKKGSAVLKTREVVMNNWKMPKMPDLSVARSH